MLNPEMASFYHFVSRLGSVQQQQLQFEDLCRLVGILCKFGSVSSGLASPASSAPMHLKILRTRLCARTSHCACPLLSGAATCWRCGDVGVLWWFGDATRMTA
jgi:hypothetical protein